MIGGAFRTHYKIGLSWFDPIFVKFQFNWGSKFGGKDAY